jgi:hypothetical protein
MAKPRIQETAVPDAPTPIPTSDPGPTPVEITGYNKPTPAVAPTPEVAPAPSQGVVTATVADGALRIDTGNAPAYTSPPVFLKPEPTAPPAAVAPPGLEVSSQVTPEPAAPAPAPPTTVASPLSGLAPAGFLIGWVAHEIDSVPDHNGVTHKIRVHTLGMFPMVRP